MWHDAQFACKIGMISLLKPCAGTGWLVDVDVGAIVEVAAIDVDDVVCGEVAGVDGSLTTEATSAVLGAAAGVLESDPPQEAIATTSTTAAPREHLGNFIR